MKLALISVYHKDGIETIGRRLRDAGWQIISTGGTARHLNDHGVDVIEVSDLTQFPEILDGRVKTLHPLVFGPILAKKTEAHLTQLKQFDTSKIDLVMVNFYPFEEALADRDKGLDAMLENIDIGGPSMVRAAAKNFPGTIVVVDSADYESTVDRLIETGDLDLPDRQALAQKAFSYCSFYDSLIARYLSTEGGILTPYFSLAGRKSMDLRYGENPHQKASLYIHDRESPLARFAKLQGKDLSFNNLLDISMVYEVVSCTPQKEMFSVIVKHQNPCGAALAATQSEAFERALAGDPKSAFGGIVGFNRRVEGPTAKAMAQVFFEVVVAPDFSPDALGILRKKKNLRLIQMDFGYREPLDVKTVPGGFLMQDRDHSTEEMASFRLQTTRSPKPGEKNDVAFGWKLMKFVKSNGIILVKDRMLIGVGAGQMSRVDAVEIAISKSETALDGAVLLSDAFFPFPDSIERAAEKKISVVVEPGGSVRDEEVIAAAEKHRISLLFTGVRHFRH